MPAHCPHCHAELPEAATFCAVCGRRIEGWSAVPKGASGEPLPGSEEPTRGMNVTPSMLRPVAKKSPTPSGPVESDSALMRAYKRNRAPVLIVLVLLAAGAGAGVFLLLRRPPPPVVATRPDVQAAPVPSAPIATPPPKKTVRHSRGPHRAEAVTVGKGGKIVASSEAPKPPRETKSGGLPHKTVATDSKTAPEPSKPAPIAPNPVTDPVEEAAPQTEADQKQEAEARIDADGVRFVVKAHVAQVHACYSRVFKDSSPGGRVEIGFAIDKDGKATRVRTEANSTDSELLSKCLEQRIKEWQFPRPVGGEYELIYPFVFAAGS
jgi:hypothetical protein